MRHATLLRGSSQLVSARAALVEAAHLVERLGAGDRELDVHRVGDRLLAADELLRAGLATLREALREGGEAG